MLKKIFFLMIAVMLIPISADAAAKELNIGIICPRTGPVTHMGTQMVNSLQIAVDTFGDLKVGGDTYKVNIVVYDDGFDPTKSVTGLRKLVEFNKTPVVWGGLGTPTSMAVMKENEALNVLLWPWTGALAPIKAGNKLAMFHRPPPEFTSGPLADVLFKAGFKSVCIVTDVSETYQLQGTNFGERIKKLGGKLLAFEVVDQKTVTDFTPIVTNFKAKKPDMMMFVAYQEPTALMINAARQIGYKGQLVLTSEFQAKGLQLTGAEAVEGSYTDIYETAYYYLYPEEDKRGNARAFQEKYKKRYGESAHQVGAMIYDSALLTLRAIELAGTVTNPAAIRTKVSAAAAEGKQPTMVAWKDVIYPEGMLYIWPLWLGKWQNGRLQLIEEVNIPKDILKQ